MIQQTNAAGLYYRLSCDDGGEGESNSIVTQRQMLHRYADEQGFTVYDEYVDDGISGTTFNRPGFLRMIRDIEDGKVNTVICKDLSRLGRDNPTVMYYTDTYFPEHAVRFISVNENFDSSRGDNEFLPFMSVVNEMYARDISRKTRAAKRTKALNGEFIAAYAPYGYLKNPDNPRKLIPDPETVGTVRHMFRLAAEGMNPYKIARQLEAEGILTPRALQNQQYGYFPNGFHMQFPTDWSVVTVKAMLKNRVYIGHMVGGKTTTKSFKNRSLVYLPEEQWIEVQNTHEALIDERTFEQVQKLIGQRKIPNTTGAPNLFAGLLFCSECGTGLSIVGPKGAYVCNGYRRRGTRYCTQHYTRSDSLSQAVLHDIQRHARIAKLYENELFDYAQKLFPREAESATRKEFDRLRRREMELRAIIQKLVEKNALGIIADDRFAELYRGYEAEQAQLSPKAAALQERMEREENERGNLSNFLDLIRRYSDVEELDATMLNDLVDRIVVHEGQGKGYKNRKQKIEIFYRFVGDLHFDEM